MELPEIPTRVVLAPMAGGVGTPELVAAVAEAGALGFLPAGYLTAERLGVSLDALEALTRAPYGVNVFVPEASSPQRTSAAEQYAALVRPWAEARGLPVGEVRWTDDDYDRKVELLLARPPALVSFAFGVPEPDVIAALRTAGVPVLVTVNGVREAREAAQRGVDGLVVQGWEAGAHQGGWIDGEPTLGLLPLLQRVRGVVDLPLVAAGGLATGSAVAAVLAAGATAAMAGTAFMCCPEAGTSPEHVAALRAPGETVMTRSFTGRPARAIGNAFTRAHDEHAPRAYPEVHQVTAPMRAAARERGDVDAVNLWAGQAHALCRTEPAAAVVERLAHAERGAPGR